MILQQHIPYDWRVKRTLPGITPLDMADWILVDDVFDAQMAERERLLAERRADVLWLDPIARDAALELLDMVIEALPDRFVVEGATVSRPDGVQVRLDRSDPLGTLGRLVQEDFCLLVKEGDEHVLRGAVLCFPASWTLAEKAGRPLASIHIPVLPYDAEMAKRVQRLFDGVKPGRPLWRFNALRYVDPALFQPRTEADKRPQDRNPGAPYVRSERQCILRLPRCGAVVFSIHTYMIEAPVDGA